jgi:hypothetical protein
MPTIGDLAAAVGLPLAISLVVLLIAWRPWRCEDDGPPPRGMWGGAIAIGFGLAAAMAVFPEWPPVVPPGTRWQWLQMAAVGAAIVGVVAAFSEQSSRRGLPLRVVIGVALAVVAAGTLQPTGDVERPELWRGGLGVAVLIWWLLMEPLALRLRGPWVALALVLSCVAASSLILLAGFSKLALLVGGLAATLGPAFVYSLWNSRGSLAGGGIAATAVLSPMSLTIGYFYMEHEPALPLGSFALIAFAPLALWLTQLPALRRMCSWHRGALATLAVAAVLAAAIAPVVSLQAAESADSFDAGS